MESGLFARYVQVVETGQPLEFETLYQRDSNSRWLLVSLVKLDDGLIARIKQQIRVNTTTRHVPAKVVQVPDIPRTKSNKIVELAVREVVHGRPVKNLEALANPEALAHFRDRPELGEP